MQLTLIRASTPHHGYYPDGFLPYSNWADRDHDPQLAFRSQNGQIVLRSEPLFKLKPNLETKTKNRVDLYLPPGSAQELAADVVSTIGPGGTPNLSGVDPEYFRQGDKQLPEIGDRAIITYESAELAILGYTASGANNRIFVEVESPRPSFGEMDSPALHLGIELTESAGAIDDSKVSKVDVPVGELRTGDEQNPIARAPGAFEMKLPNSKARSLAASIIDFLQ